VRGRRPLAWFGGFTKCFARVQWPIPKLPTSLHDGKAGSKLQVQHISTDLSSTTLDSDESKTKRSHAGWDQWNKVAVQLCARGRELNLGWKPRNCQTCWYRFDKLISKQKPTGFTEVPEIVDSAVPEMVNENLEEELGPELAVLSSKTTKPFFSSVDSGRQCV